MNRKVLKSLKQLTGNMAFKLGFVLRFILVTSAVVFEVAKTPKTQYL